MTDYKRIQKETKPNEAVSFSHVLTTELYPGQLREFFIENLTDDKSFNVIESPKQIVKSFPALTFI